MKIIHRAKLYASEDKLSSALKENNELIAIFVRSIETAKKNMQMSVGAQFKSAIVNR